MAINPTRRAELADAAVMLLAAEGPRGLTHRGVDATAGAPRGTASNYFATRDDIIRAVIIRIGERLAPEPAVGAALDERLSGVDLYSAYVRDIARRLLSDRDATISLFELRLEATRNTEVAAALDAWRAAALDADIAFTAERELPGGRTGVLLLHYAIDGLILDRLARPLDPDTPFDRVIDELTSRLLA